MYTFLADLVDCISIALLVSMRFVLVWLAVLEGKLFKIFFLQDKIRVRNFVFKQQYIIMFMDEFMITNSLLTDSNTLIHRGIALLDGHLRNFSIIEIS